MIDRLDSQAGGAVNSSPCPQAKACGSAGANESSQSRGLQPMGFFCLTVGAVLGIELFGTCALSGLGNQGQIRRQGCH